MTSKVEQFWVVDLIRGREPSAELTVGSGHHEYRSVDA